MKYNHRRIVIRGSVPTICTDAEIARFVHDAVTSMGGQFHPSDPLFNSIDVDSIEIRGTQYVNESDE